MTWVALALLGWLLGAGLHWWPGPLRVVTSMYRHATKRWSDSDDTTDDEDDGDVVTDEWDEDDQGDGRVRYIRRPVGPRPLGELLGEDDDQAADEQDDDRSQDARRRWVAMQVAKGRRATDIQREGAQRYGCTERTIQRDRDRALAARPRRGTMRRDDR